MADIPSRRSTIIAERFTVIGNTFKRAIKSNPKDRIEIEIGDSKQPDFKPQAKISRWDNEVNFSLRAEEHPEAVVRTEGKLIKYITPDYEVHQYELDPGEIGEDGGLEFEWVLPKKPESNVLTATIQTKELDFFYQPALTQEEIDEGSQRPENVVGSYAVYHRTKGGMNRDGGMEYKTGKAFHIYRPKVTDKKGKETWAELNIDETSGVLSVTVQQEFLDKAAYPVIVDPTFGYTTKGGTSSTNTPGTLDIIFCAQYAIPTSGTLDSVSYYLKQNGTENPDFEFLVYNDGSDYPTSLLATSTSTWRLTDSWDNWKTLNFSSENLVTGNYWLSSFTDGSRGSSEDSFITYYDTISTNRRVSSFNEVAWPTPSDPFPSGKTVATNLKISIYATYSAKFHNLTDNFDDNSINATIWNDDTASETGGQMVVTANTSTGTYNGISSDSRYDLTESYAFIQLVSAGDTSLSFTTYILELYNDTVDLYWAIEYGATDEIVAYKSPDSVNYTEKYRATYSSTDHKWFRIRESGGTTYWDTSADGWNWTNRASDATGYDLTALNVFFGVENPASGSTTVTFDNFNIPQGISVSDSSSITESVTVSIGSGLSTPSPSVSDSSTITEAVTVDVSDPQVGVSDNITITDSLPAYSQTETATITESIGLLITSQINIAVSDSATITEAVTTDVSDPQIVATENSTISESVAVSIIDASALAVGVSDNASITESVVADVSDPQVFVSDTSVITESVSVTVSTLDTPQPVVSDTITIAENVGVVVSDPLVAASDNATITELVSVSVEAIVDRSIAVNETATISENVVTALSDLQIVASESASVAELVSMLIGYRYKKNDRLNLDIGSGLSIPLGKPLSPSWGSNTRPSSPKIDEYGYNKQTGEWEIYTEEGWKTFQDITISASEPENPKENDLWIDIS